MAVTLPTFTISVEPYGEFKAKARDFETEARISYRTDEQMAARGMDPNVASPTTRRLFYYLTVFAETCESAPDGFEVSDLLKEAPEKAQQFLLEYLNSLYEKEQSFRKGAETVVPGTPVQGDVQAPVQGEATPTVG